MKRDHALMRRFERDFVRNHPLSLERAFAVYEAMWNEAVALGVLPLRDRLEGIEDDIRLARALNACSRPSSSG